MELDSLDLKAADCFEGYIVRKDLVRTFARQFPVPTYVVEFMLGRYCASTDPDEIDEGLEIVQRQLSSRTVRAGEEELFKARAYKDGSAKLIDIVSVRFVEKEGGYLASLPSLNLGRVRIPDKIVDDNEPAAFTLKLHLNTTALLPKRKVMRSVFLSCVRFKCPSATCLMY